MESDCETKAKLEAWLKDLRAAMKDELGDDWDVPGECGEKVDMVISRGFVASNVG